MSNTATDGAGTGRIDWNVLRIEARKYRELVHKFTQSDKPALRTEEEEFAEKLRAYAAQENTTIRQVADELMADFWD